MKKLTQFAALLILLLATAPSSIFAYLVSTTGSGAEMKWFTRTVSYYINTSSAPSGGSTALQNAQNTWNAVSGATFDFNYAGTTSKSGSTYDFYNVHSFVNLGAGETVAVNYFWSDSSTGQIVDSDILYNTYYSWSTSGAAGYMDVQNVATHELGHSLSLADVYGAGDSEKTMYGYVATGETKKRSLDTDDIAGIRYLYPLLAPASVSAADGTSTAYVRVTWGSVSGATHYRVARSDTSGGAKTELGSWQTGTTYDDTGATQGTTYYYFVRASAGSAGEYASAYSAYNTGWRALPAPTGVSATDGTSSAYVRVTWGSVSGATHYRVSRATTSGGTKTLLGASWQTGTTYDDTSATPGVTYYYFVRASNNSSGTNPSAYSAYDTGWRVENNPTGFSATSLPGSQVGLTWLKNPAGDDVMVAWNTSGTFGTPSGTYAVGASITGGGTVLYNGSGTNVSHTGLTAGTTYYYKAWSVSAGPAYSSGTTCFATVGMSVLLTEGFENGGAMPPGWTQDYVSGTVNWEFLTGGYLSHPAAAHGGIYNARLYYGSSAGAKTKLISPMIDFGASPQNPQLTFWHAMEVWVSDQDELRVYYKTSSGGSWTLLATYTASVASWTERTLALPNPSSTYYIAFEGYAKYGYGVCIDDVQVMAMNGNTPAPTGVSATDGTSTAYVRVTWGSVSGATHYRVARSTTSGGTKTELGSWQTGTSYDDASATPGTTYYYFVRAATSSDGANASDYSAYDTGWRALSAPTGVAATDGTSTAHVRTTWSSVSGATHYRVARSTTSGGIKTELGSWQAGTTYDDTSATPGVTYYYFVRAATSSAGANPSAYSSYNTGWRALAAPTGVAATDSNPFEVTVTWNAVPSATHYRVYRAYSPDGVKTVLSGWQTGLTYSDTTVEPWEVCYYWVAASVSSSGTYPSAYSDYAVGRLKPYSPAGTLIGIGYNPGFSQPLTVMTNLLPFTEGFEAYPPETFVSDISSWTTMEGDASKVILLDYDYTATPMPLETTHTKVLQLETEGQALHVVFGTNGVAQTRNIWVDMMACMLPSEDDPVLDEEDGPLAAVFVNCYSNLIFYAAALEATGQRTTGFFNLTPDQEISPEAWRRLTFNLVRDAVNANDYIRVFLDGQVLTHAAARVSPEHSDTGGTWFCLTRYENVPLPGLLFQGTGRIDDMSVTADLTPVALPCTIITAAGSNGWADIDSPLTVPSGIATQIVYTADDWYRIDTLLENGMDLGASGVKVHTQTLHTVKSDISNNVSFALLPDVHNGQGGNVPSAWLAANVPEGFIPDDDGLSTEAEWLLDMNPSTSNTVMFDVQSIAVDTVSTTVAITIRLTVDGGRVSTQASGVLTLWESDDLADWAVVRSGAVGGGDFDGNGICVWNATGIDPSKFYKVTIELPALP